MSNEASQLDRLAGLLADRGAPIDRVVAAASVSGMATAFLGVSALTPRLELLVPIRDQALEVVAPGVTPGALPERGSLSISIDGSQLDAAIVAIGNPPLQDAVREVAPFAAGTWSGAVAGLLATPGTSIMNRTRYLTRPRGGVAVAFPTRDADGDRRFIRGVQDHAAAIGVSDEHRTLWSSAYAALASAGPVSIHAECTPGGPVARIAARHSHVSWDRAIDAVKVMVEIGRARDAAARMGAVAGSFAVDQPRGVEIVIGPELDVVAWIAPRPAT